MTQAKSNGKTTDVKVGNSVADQVAKRTYAAPELVCHGDVRDVTLGVSGGVGESGMTATKKA